MTPTHPMPDHPAVVRRADVAKLLREKFFEFGQEDPRPWDTIGEDQRGWLDLADEVNALASSLPVERAAPEPDASRLRAVIARVEALHVSEFGDVTRELDGSYLHRDAVLAALRGNDVR